METNVTQLLKNKKVTEFIDSFLDKKVYKDFKFNLAAKKFNSKEIKHKNYALIGTAIDYYFRYKIAKRFNIKMSQLIAEKSLYLLKIHIFDFTDKNDNLMYVTILNLIKKYKSLNIKEKNFPFLALGMVDNFYRSGVFDKYNFWTHLLQFNDYLKDSDNITPLIEDFNAVRSNVDKLLYVLKIHKPIYLNPNLTQEIKGVLVKGDADIISYNVLWELKTTLNTSIPISYIRQLLVYYWLIKRENKDNKVFYFYIINTRATNFFSFRISDLLKTEPRDFFVKFDAFIRKEFKNAI